MKTKLSLFLMVFFILVKISYGDVIPDNSHHVNKCVRITNVEEYPDVSLIGFIPPMIWEASAYVITSSECLNQGYRLNDFNVYAVSKAYLAGKDINKLDFPRIPVALPSNIRIEPYLGYLHDSIPISGIEEFYKIAGFTDSKVVLYKWKQITKYNNGKPDLTETFDYEGNIAQLYQKIQTNVSSVTSLPSFDIYPNPIHRNIHLKMHNMYSGNVMIELVNMDGKLIKTFNFNKFSYTEDTDILLDNLIKGGYLLNLKFGNTSESKKIIIR